LVRSALARKKNAGGRGRGDDKTRGVALVVSTIPGGAAQIGSREGTGGVNRLRCVHISVYERGKTEKKRSRPRQATRGSERRRKGLENLSRETLWSKGTKGKGSAGNVKLEGKQEPNQWVTFRHKGKPVGGGGGGFWGVGLGRSGGVGVSWGGCEALGRVVGSVWVFFLGGGWVGCVDVWL